MSSNNRGDDSYKLERTAMPSHARLQWRHVGASSVLGRWCSKETNL